MGKKWLQLLQKQWIVQNCPASKGHDSRLLLNPKSARFAHPTEGTLFPWIMKYGIFLCSAAVASFPACSHFFLPLHRRQRGGSHRPGIKQGTCRRFVIWQFMNTLEKHSSNSVPHSHSGSMVQCIKWSMLVKLCNSWAVPSIKRNCIIWPKK